MVGQAVSPALSRSAGIFQQPARLDRLFIFQPGLFLAYFVIHSVMQPRLILCVLAAMVVAPLLFAADEYFLPVQLRRRQRRRSFRQLRIDHSTPPTGMFWYGTPALWTRIPNDATWHGNSVSDKLFLWQQGYDPAYRTTADIAVAIRRLNDPYPGCRAVALWNKCYF